MLYLARCLDCGERKPCVAFHALKSDGTSSVSYYCTFCYRKTECCLDNKFRHQPFVHRFVCAGCGRRFSSLEVIDHFGSENDPNALEFCPECWEDHIRELAEAGLTLEDVYRESDKRGRE